MELQKHACLNCGATLVSRYCQDCGQKADTHRITLPHLIQHDLVHGLWHFDKGLLYTVREAFLRPGHMAMDYIKGKRVKYYNIFYLILIVLGLNVLTAHYLKLHYQVAPSVEHEGLVLDHDSVDISYYIKHYFKLILFLIIPFFAVCGVTVFRRLKLNFAEHAILAGSLMLTGIMWYFFVIIGIYTSNDIDSEVFDYFIWALAYFVCLQPVRVYFQAARKYYTTAGYILRILLWYLCLFVLLAIILITIALASGKTNIKLS